MTARQRIGDVDTPRGCPPITRNRLAAVRGLPDSPVPWTARGIDSRYLLPRWPVSPGRSVSVIVPAWNSGESLPACVQGLTHALAGFEASDAEIILVDDGSHSPVADSISQIPNERELQVLRVEHLGQSRASNAGALRATGDVLIFCDSDMILNPWSVVSLIEAIDRWPHGLCFGFREPVGHHEARLAVERLRTKSDAIPLIASGDNRFLFDIPGVPSNLFATTNNLEDLTADRRVWPPGRTAWSLPRMAFGCLLACRRETFLQMGGFDGRFIRWGYNDTELAARWIASGRPLVPVFTAGGLHIEHAPRHPLQWRMAGSAAKMYECTLGEGWVRSKVCASPILGAKSLAANVKHAGTQLAKPTFHGHATARAAARVGDLDLFEAATGLQAIDAVQQANLTELALRVLRMSGAPDYLNLSPPATDDAATALETGLLAAAIGDLDLARDQLAKAQGDPQSR
jgi:GT2 family glycosyltransferase